MRIKRNKCVEIKGQYKSLIMYNQLVGQHDYMTKPCIRVRFRTLFFLSACVLYALYVFVYVLVLLANLELNYPGSERTPSTRKKPRSESVAGQRGPT